jgi:cytochrome c556
VEYGAIVARSPREPSQSRAFFGPIQEVSMVSLRSLALAASAAVVGGLFSIPASAQFAKAEDAVKYRQSAMFIMNANMGRLAAMARGDRPFDAAVAQNSARAIEAVSKLPWDGFQKGADSKRAKPEIWASAADFKGYQDRLMAEAAKLPGAAASLDSLKQQVGATGGVCKNCHDKFRND